MILHEDQQRLVISLFSLIFLSYPIRFLPSSNIRYIYSLLVGSLIQIYVFRSDMIVIYIQHAIVFAIIKFKGPQCGFLVTL
jgi:hypothetical protein